MLLHEWLNKQKSLTDKQKDFVTDLLFNLSASKYGFDKVGNRPIEALKKLYPEYNINISSVDELDFNKYDELMKNALGDVDSVDVLRGFGLQRLCRPLAIELLSTANSDRAKQCQEELKAMPEID